MGLDQASRSDSVIGELHSLHEKNVLRLIDIIVVVRNVDGTTTAEGRTELTSSEALQIQQFVSDALGFQVGRQDFGASMNWKGLSVVLGPEDVKFIADMVEPGRAALAVVFEHRWAIRLDDLIHGSGVKVMEDEVLWLQDRPGFGGDNALA